MSGNFFGFGREKSFGFGCGGFGGFGGCGGDGGSCGRRRSREDRFRFRRGCDRDCD